MNRPRWLTRLFENGSVGHSAVNPKILKELLSLGLVCVKTAGVHRTVAVSDPPQLDQWLQARYPQHAIDPDRLHTRKGNIVRSGRSKAGKSSHHVLPVQFKWFGAGSDPWTRITEKYGMAAVLTDRLAGLALPARWRLLTIENWEPFYRADYTGATIAVMVVYLGGNVSDIFIDALTTFDRPPESVLHFGDYDWEGLYIFQRLQKAIPSACLYVPKHIDELFRKFGDRKLVEKQKRKAAFDMGNRECLPIIELIEQSNAGLEQEIVDLPEFFPTVQMPREKP